MVMVRCASAFQCMNTLSNSGMTFLVMQQKLVGIRYNQTYEGTRGIYIKVTPYFSGIYNERTSVFLNCINGNNLLH